MTVEVPQSHEDLLEDETRAFAILATIMDDGTPQATPIWFNVVDGKITINTARGRVKEHNMSARPDIALAILDPDDPYRYMQMRGRVVDESEENARRHIDELAGKYTGEADYKNYQGETRVKYTIEPRSISVAG
ncbi:MAG: PPOX class F420-dependent oxidoreductase [Anaerolineales bacterium]|jgi:PPOX class probable F420-dependent enzyme